MTQAQVLTGMIFPSAGVRIIIPLVVANFIEEASGLTMYEMSDYNIGSSVGGVLSSAFALRDRKSGRPAFSAREVYHCVFATAHAMFRQDPDMIMRNNVMGDIPGFLRSTEKNGFLARSIASHIDRGRALRDSRYDNNHLRRALDHKFGSRQMADCDKTNLVMAYNVQAEATSLFGHIDRGIFSPKGLDLGIHIDDPEYSDEHNVPLHENVGMTDALLAATAIPGFIGYQPVESLKSHFMDAGSFGNFAGLVEDLHAMAVNRSAPRPPTAPPKRWWWGSRKPAPAADLPPLVSRIIMMGIGSEKGMNDFDLTGEAGVASQATCIVRAAGHMSASASIAQINKRFNREARAQLNAPAVRLIDSRLVSMQTDAPSIDIKDGRMDNLLRLNQFGRHVCIENREAIIDEIVLRAQTLHVRGLKTAEELKSILQRIEAIRSVEGATALVDSIVIRPQDAERILHLHGIDVDKPRRPRPETRLWGRTRTAEPTAPAGPWPATA